MIQTPAADYPQSAHKSHWSVPRTPCESVNAGGFCHPFKQRTILLVIVTDQVLWILIKRRRFAQLLGDPCVRRVFRHAEVRYAPTCMVHCHDGMNCLE